MKSKRCLRVEPLESRQMLAAVTGSVSAEIRDNGPSGDQAGDPLTNWVVFSDHNRNGQRDPGERATLTDSQGRYRLNLPVGTHRIAIEVKDGFRAAQKARSVVIERENDAKSDKDFSVARKNAVRGCVFHDRDSDGEAGSSESEKLKNWTVFIDANRNGLLDSTERSVYTNANGCYRFDSVRPGVHRIDVAPVVSTRSTATFSGQPRTVVVAREGESTVRLIPISSPGSTSVPVQLKRGQVPRAAANNISIVSGRVFSDADGNGRLSDGDGRVQDWIVYADANRNGALDAGEKSTRTNDSGRYTLRLPNTGVQRIGVVLAGTVAPSNQFRSVDTSTGDKEKRDFGLTFPMSISGRVSEVVTTTGIAGTGDEANNVQPTSCLGITEGCQITETEIAVRGAWIVYIDTNRNGIHDRNEQWTHVDGDGHYELNSLRAATHRIQVEAGQYTREENFRVTNSQRADPWGRTVDVSSGSRDHIDFRLENTATTTLSGRVLNFYPPYGNTAHDRFSEGTGIANRAVVAGNQTTMTNSEGWFTFTFSPTGNIEWYRYFVHVPYDWETEFVDVAFNSTFGFQDCYRVGLKYRGGTESLDFILLDSELVWGENP